MMGDSGNKREVYKDEYREGLGCDFCQRLKVEWACGHNGMKDK